MDRRRRHAACCLFTGDICGHHCGVAKAATMPSRHFYTPSALALCCWKDVASRSSRSAALGVNRTDVALWVVLDLGGTVLPPTCL
jgi:hypothetical protein